MDRYKKINIVITTVAVVVFLFIKLTWKNCVVANCSEYTIDYVLGPVQNISLTLALISLVFLFLPSHNFEKWLKWIFLWMFPLYIALVYTLGDDSGQIISFPYALVAQLLGYLFAGISLVFVLSRFIYIRFFKKT